MTIQFPAVDHNSSLSVDQLLELAKSGNLKSPNQTGRRNRRRAMRQNGSHGTLIAALLAAQGCNVTSGGDRLELEPTSDAGAPPPTDMSGSAQAQALEAQNDAGYQAAGGEELLIPVEQLLENDTGTDGQSLEVVAVSNAENGDVSLEGGFVKFTPADGYAGPASFEYEVAGGDGERSSARVDIGVEPTPTLTAEDREIGPSTTPIFEETDQPAPIEDARDSSAPADIPIDGPDLSEAPMQDPDPTEEDGHMHDDSAEDGEPVHQTMPMDHGDGPHMPDEEGDAPHHHDPMEDGGHDHGEAPHEHGMPHDMGHPHPDDPSKHAEHVAAFNLVPVEDASHIAVKSGSWFDPSTWANGEVPGDDASVVIPYGVEVAYDGEAVDSIFTIRVDGELNFATDQDTFLEVDTLVVSPSGALSIGTLENPVSEGVQSVISFADNGPIDVAWDPMLLSRGLISHGKVDIHGAEKENFAKVAVDPMAGDTSLLLDGDAQGWQVGDKIVLTGTHLVDREREDGSPYRYGDVIEDRTQDEELVITRIEGDRIYFDQPLQYDHDAPRGDLKAYVANYSRNVRFESENADSIPVHQRGHVMFMHNDDIDVRYAEFHELGRSDKSERGFDVGDIDNVQADSNVKGRYAVHLHRAGVDDLGDPAMLIGNSVWGSPGWGFVHHDSNAIISGNAAYDVFGAAFVAETGNETGRWADNIAIKSTGVFRGSKDSEDVAAFDLGRNGVGFWHQGRLVESADNVAAGMPSGAGFVYLHRGSNDDLINVDSASAAQNEKFRFADEVGVGTPNITVFDNNEVIASRRGVEITKGGPQQGHDVRSVLEDFTAWEVHTGVWLEYTAHYTLIDVDLVGTRTDLRDEAGTAGIEIFNNAFDIVVNGATIDGFTTGVYPHKVRVNNIANVTGPDEFDYIYIDVNITGADVGFANVTPGDTFLTRDDLVEGRLLYTPDFEGAVAPGGSNEPDLILNGTKVDSIGSTQTSNAWDPFTFSATALRGALEQNGYWKTDDGRTVTLIEEYIADRATGDVVKTGVFVEVPEDRLLIVDRFVRTEPTYNGVLDEDSAPPVANADFANVRAGESVILDVLANDTDPDGDSLQLGGLWSTDSRVVANDDGTVTFFADPDAEGPIAFHYWAEDDHGNFSLGQATVNVDI